MSAYLFAQKSIFLPFDQRNLRVLYFSRAVSLFGSTLSRFAIPLLIYKKTGNGQIMAASAFFMLLGTVISGFFLSHMSDGYQPKNLMIRLEAISAISILILLLLHNTTPHIYYLVSMILGACQTLFLTSTSKLLSLIEMITKT